MTWTLGKPNCPNCHGSGWAQAAPILKSRGDGSTFTEYPAVRICECRGGSPPEPDGPIVTRDMKLDAQNRASGERDS